MEQLLECFSFILLATKKTFFILKLALHMIVYIKKKTQQKLNDEST